jgi:diguanylate cyclase (GGDEF)-like protein
MNLSEATADSARTQLSIKARNRDRTALLLDTDKVLRVTLGRFLERLGFSVTLFADGHDAIASLRAAAVDLVLMDAILPGIDGFDACSLMRTLPTAKSTPILMILGRDDQVSVERAVEVGASDYITKPISWPILRHRVTRLVRSVEAEQVLSAHRAMVQSMVDAFEDLAIVCDADGVVQWINGAAASAPGICEPKLAHRLTFGGDVRDADSVALHGEELLSELIAVTAGAGHAEQRLLERTRRGQPSLFAALRARPVLGSSGDSQGVILTLRDVTEQEQGRRRLQGRMSTLDERANRDELTGLANRRLFRQRLDDALEASGEDETQVGLLMIELDGLAVVNRDLGKASGDLLLRTVAQRLGALVRRGDTVAWLGDAAFAIIVTDCPQPEVARRVAKKVVDAIAEPLPPELEGHGVSANVGVAVYPRDASMAAELVRLADVAMCQVKATGGGIGLHGLETASTT